MDPQVDVAQVVDDATQAPIQRTGRAARKSAPITPTAPSVAPATPLQGLLALQRTAGNRATAELIRRRGPKGVSLAPAANAPGITDEAAEGVGAMFGQAETDARDAEQAQDADWKATLSQLRHTRRNDPGKVAPAPAGGDATRQRDSSIAANLSQKFNVENRDRPAPGKVAANDPRKAALEGHLSGLATAPQRYDALVTDREEKERLAAEAQREAAWTGYLAEKSIDVADQSEGFLKNLKGAFLAWHGAKGAKAKQQPRKELDQFLKGAAADRSNVLGMRAYKERQAQDADYAARFATLLGTVAQGSDKAQNQQVDALLRDVKGQIDTISSKSDNVSANFASDLQATAKRTYPPGVVMVAGDYWADSFYRFANGDQHYRGPHQKGAQSAAAAGAGLPQANFEAPLSRDKKGKINVHVNVGTPKASGATDAYTFTAEDVAKKVTKSVGWVLGFAKASRSNGWRHELGLLRDKRYVFSAEDVAWFEDNRNESF